MKTPATLWISSMLIAVLAMVFPLAVPLSAAEPDDSDAVFQAKAKELVAGKTARLDKIMGVYAFVRDSIRQVETKFS